MKPIMRRQPQFTSRLSPIVAAIGLLLLPLTMPAGDPRTPQAKKSIDPDRVQRVLAQLRKVAEANAVDPKTKKTGDDLADHYVRELADFCVKEKIPVKEYLAAVLPGLNRRTLSQVANLTPARWAASRG